VSDALAAGLVFLPRCPWAASPALIAYHDAEWGVGVRDDRALFELLILEGAQAGLSWETVLVRRERYRIAYENFDIARVAAFDDRKAAALLADPGLIRHRQKIEASVINARAALKLIADRGSLSDYFWSFVDGRPIINRPRAMADVPASTPASVDMSRDLRARGFKFVGPTICYAFMQAAGLVDDHLRSCHRCRPS
jgi:DNA-3-methyladenine glycosylase I